MGKTVFVECQNCGRIHYVVDKVKAKGIEADSNEFSKRNLAHCSKCGLKGHFKGVSSFYIRQFLSSDRIEPVLLEQEKIQSKGI